MARRQDPISWEKLHELHVAPINHILSVILDLCRMMVGTLPEFIAATATLLGTTWGSHHHTFKVKEKSSLAG